MPTPEPVQESEAAAQEAEAREPIEVAAVIRDATASRADLNMDLMHRMATLQIQKKAKDAALKEVTREIAAIQDQCLSEMAAAGVERLPMITADGTITLYVHSQMWARPIGGAEGRPAVCEALRAEGLDEFVKEDFNVQQLSGYARELDRNGDAIPTRLSAVLDVSTVVGIRARNS